MEPLLKNENFCKLVEILNLDVGAISRLLDEFGGYLLYLPKWETLQRTIRNRNIYDAVSRYSLLPDYVCERVAKEFGVTEAVVRKVATTWKERRCREKFRKIFGV